MTARPLLVLAASLALALAACGVPPNPEGEAPDVPAATADDPTPDVSAAAEPLVIAAKAFDGIAIGVPRAEIADRLVREGDPGPGGEQSYFVTDEAGMRTGVVTLDAGERVVRIAVTNTEAETVDRLGVGSTLAELEGVYGEGLEVLGDGRAEPVRVEAGGLEWQLDAAPGEVSSQSTVTAVVIR